MRRSGAQQPLLDGGILLAVVVLALFGLMMQLSASIGIAEYRMGSPFYYFERQTAFMFVAVTMAAVVFYKVPLACIERLSLPLMVLGIGLLLLVLIPGVGVKINGSYRWIDLGVVRAQPSEVVKLCLFIYLARFFSRLHGQGNAYHVSQFVMPSIVLVLTLFLLLLEPDFGSTVVIAATAVGLLFISGFSLAKFLLVGSIAASSALALVFSSPYRMRRLTSFFDPWSDPFDSGFQLSQALIAFGRGEVTGTGLGASIQKYAYLPEAHTDFIFAVIGEELGVIGVCAVVLLFLFIAMKTVSLGKRILEKGQSPFAGYLVVAIGFWVGLQASINMGVNLGLLPTKGITLPFLSYGGSSLMVSCMAFAFVLRASYEMNSVSDSGHHHLARSGYRRRSRKQRPGYV